MHVNDYMEKHGIHNEHYGYCRWIVGLPYESVESIMSTHEWFKNFWYHHGSQAFALRIFKHGNFLSAFSTDLAKYNYKEIEKKYRVDFWIGIGTATWLIAIFSTILGYYSADFLNREMMIGLAIINPIYFTCTMIGVMKSIQLNVSIILGAILGPLFYFISPDWCVLIGGFIAGTIAFVIGEKNVS